jgi:hypothetical protein
VRLLRPNLRLTGRVDVGEGRGYNDGVTAHRSMKAKTWQGVLALILVDAMITLVLERFFT